MRRRFSQRDRVLRLLRRKETVTTAELASVAHQYNSRIHELRELGYDIRAIHMGGNVFVYILLEGSHTL